MGFKFFQIKGHTLFPGGEKKQNCENIDKIKWNNHIMRKCVCWLALFLRWVIWAMGQFFLEGRGHHCIFCYCKDKNYYHDRPFMHVVSAWDRRIPRVTCPLSHGEGGSPRGQSDGGVGPLQSQRDGIRVPVLLAGWESFRGGLPQVTTQFDISLEWFYPSEDLL